MIMHLQLRNINGGQRGAFDTSAFDNTGGQMAERYAGDITLLDNGKYARDFARFACRMVLWILHH